MGEWPPVWRVSTPNPLQYQGLAAIVRTVVDDGDQTVGIKPLKEGARPVWRAAMTLEGKNIDVVVDQLTGIVTWYTDGKDSFTAKVDWESPPAAGTTWTVDAPPGTGGTTVTDESVTYAASPAAAGTAAGYAPLVSDLAPDGYALKATATRRAELLPAGWAGIDAGAPPAAAPGRAVAPAVHARPLLVHARAGGAADPAALAGARRPGRGGGGQEALVPGDDAAVRRLQRRDGPAPGTRSQGRRCSWPERAGPSSSPAR